MNGKRRDAGLRRDLEKKMDFMICEGFNAPASELLSKNGSGRDLMYYNTCFSGYKRRKMRSRRLNLYTTFIPRESTLRHRFIGCSFSFRPVDKTCQQYL